MDEGEPFFLHPIKKQKKINNTSITETTNPLITETTNPLMTETKLIIDMKQIELKTKQLQDRKHQHLHYEHIIQLNDIHQEPIMQTYVEEISKKHSSYKQQDISKEKYDANAFINFDEILSLLRCCELKCHYCLCELFVLYSKSRFPQQWTLDRIDNTLGHNRDNLVISCLECNLKRRRRSDKHFQFMKQMVISKEE
jgi:hypothetical protein